MATFVSETKVSDTIITGHVLRISLTKHENLEKSDQGNDLRPSLPRHGRERLQPPRHVLELDVLRRAQPNASGYRPVPQRVRNRHADDRQHRHPPVLELGLAVEREVVVVR
eukprot:CAMPEP_0183304370 /NCGR_PEP_ID=MMETSP0160_2-20130417/9477_1 /TAXON_ID=2839 ORGANISM="Odontella Sinensis, Strain Grunow 1884" /NCGR_SAMPLE_ID=MMETSP0160_2 /ASSEMBLY_ACC=CAM_ASM_000250 /LENGTH=110 /DNA_ID=CAMNT_0025467405 /DNA_START=119 /DNA_END=451 /DNA_ORIENTATION=-